MAHISKYAQPKFNPNHPFKWAIRRMIGYHFAPSIAERFDVIMEVEKYHLDTLRTKNLIKQVEDQKFVAELYYQEANGVSKFICDLYSWESQTRTQAHILKMITDKYKSGQIGSDWTESNGAISVDVMSGKHETPDSEITKYMPSQSKLTQKKGGKK